MNKLEEENLHIFCCGMMRSGSTLQYNIVKDIFDLKDYSYESKYFIDTIKWSEFGSDASICKTHDLTSSPLLNIDQFKFVYI